MKNNYYKTNGDIDIRIKENTVIIDSMNDEYYYTEDEAKFLCKCLVDIFNNERVFIYNDSQLRRNHDEYDIADIIRHKVEVQLIKYMIPTTGYMEFEIFGDLIKVTYRWSE